MNRQKCYFKFNVSSKTFVKILTPFKNTVARSGLTSNYMVLVKKVCACSMTMVWHIKSCDTNISFCCCGYEFTNWFHFTSYLLLICERRCSNVLNSCHSDFPEQHFSNNINGVGATLIHSWKNINIIPKEKVVAFQNIPVFLVCYSSLETFLRRRQLLYTILMQSFPRMFLN